ncbi:hypothetical protein DH2020_003495 [Rehmannia glutinosa]|uniref:Uncharacterized protein n=1 Tax=Rehmannia glutinosa TaxID=99300 RepID=A0ABR0XLV8_REHGL
MRSNGTAEAFTSIHHKFSQLSKAQTQRCIYKVHKHLRNINVKAYEPQIIGIGPYHRGKDSLQMMEEHKLRYLELLLHRKKVNIETYISAVGELEQQARDCYAQPINLNAANFIEMLFLDVTELTDANVKFRKLKSDSLFGVDFTKGVMLMPTLTIEDRTECDNQVVANIFNHLTDAVTGPNKHFMYAGIVDRVNKHYKQPWSRAMAVLRRDYFNSHWAYITFCYALLLLLLTVAQTVCSVLQVEVV